MAVNFKGNASLQPCQGTYIWAFCTTAQGVPVCIVEHDQGQLKGFVLTNVLLDADNPAELAQLNLRLLDDKKYIFATEDEIVLANENQRAQRVTEINQLINWLKSKL